MSGIQTIIINFYNESMCIFIGNADCDFLCEILYLEIKFVPVLIILRI